MSLNNTYRPLTGLVNRAIKPIWTINFASSSKYQLSTSTRSEYPDGPTTTPPSSSSSDPLPAATPSSSSEPSSQASSSTSSSRSAASAKSGTSTTTRTTPSVSSALKTLSSRSSPTSSSSPSSSSSTSTSNPRQRSSKLLPSLRWSPQTQTNFLQSTHTLHVRSTRNNLLLTFSDKSGPLFPTITCGTNKQFKNSQRSTYEASHQASLKMFTKILEYIAGNPSSPSSSSSSSSTGSSSFSSTFGDNYTTYSQSFGVSRNNQVKIRLAFNGYGGSGLEAFSSALGGNDGSELRRAIVWVEDRTGWKIGGTRGRKPRRL